MKILKFKKGNILTENLIFIVLNLAFFAILVLFLFSKIGQAAVLEEKYAKEIALLVDSARPEMTITLNMEDAIKIAKKENWPLDQMVIVQDNIVRVRLREKGGYSYSFFNNVEVSAHFDTTDNKGYYFVVSKK